MKEFEFMNEFINFQKRLNVLPMEGLYAKFFIPLNRDEDMMVLADAREIQACLEENKPYPTYSTNIPMRDDMLWGLFIEYVNSLYFVPIQALEINEKKINSSNRMLKLLIAVEEIQKTKMWFMWISENGKEIYRLTKSSPTFVSPQKILDFIDGPVMNYRVGRDESSFDVETRLYSHSDVGDIKMINRTIISDFEKIDKRKVLSREDGAEIILPENENIKKEKGLLVLLSENPREFMRKYKYIKQYLSETDLLLFSDEPMDADDFVDALFDLSLKKNFLKSPAKLSLQKQLGEILLYV